ncbi:ATP-binding cassette domain-containing protein [Tunturiibacter lichenicola]|uniref:ATP-binding cassette domain-containing protein n=1 Tax=Tunturiibacter lichenicola TaxID=2051959 RepID=UPI003D9B21F1
MSDKLPEHLLTVEIEHRVGTVSLKLNFVLTQPWTVLFGPSGSGKTTVLRAIAGFVRPDAGRIVYGPMERLLVSTKEGVFMPAHLRPVRSAAQAARLFPNMSVRENVLYGMAWRSHPADEEQVLNEVLGLMRLTTLAERDVTKLSGGERQRVSVARAMAAAVAFDGPDKALLLLDEPFAGLDEILRDDLALELRSWLARWKVPVLSVSHDVGECYLLAADVVRMADGQVIEQGPVEVVLAEERRRLMERLRAGSTA